jgi:hypothetical protein
MAAIVYLWVGAAIGATVRVYLVGRRPAPAADPQVLANLTAVQARCTELLLENRELRAREKANLTPGWICAACMGFNGDAKEKLSACRACGAGRP